MSQAVPELFLSYRRGDTAFETTAIHRELVKRFTVFMDVDTIPAGQDFRQVIQEAVSKCDVMLVVIGPHWANSSDSQGQRRLHQEGDFVSLEVQAALTRKIPVMPLLIGNTAMPVAEALPPGWRN